MTAHSRLFLALALVGLLGLAALSGCVLAPEGTSQEQELVRAAGQSAQYDRPFAARTLPDLPAEPTWRDILQRAFLANGDLETAYLDWAASIQRIDIAAAYPASNLTLGYEYMFSKEAIKTWDRQTISVGVDPAMPLRWPGKAMQAGKVALEQARAADLRFQAAKFELQKKVLTAWLDYALMAEKIRIARDDLELRRMITSLAADRVRTGAPQQDLLKAQMEYRLAENQLVEMDSTLLSMRAMLNGMLARPADAPLAAPKTLPAPRPINADDATIISAGVDLNPQLASLAREVAGRKDAIELARMAYIPDLSVSASFTGSASQTLGAMLTIPMALPMIRGQIKEAETILSSTEAMLRQTRSDRAASFVATLYALRTAEHHVHTFEGTILPQSRQVLSSSRQAYAAGQITFADLLDNQRTLLEIRQFIADARIDREKRLAELEALAGVDIETFTPPTTVPVSQLDPTNDKQQMTNDR